MGEVFLAEQLEPVRRRVALKLIKPGMDSKQVMARFESERQALALMDHPAIAKVFDAGTTELGRPFFAMEYIEGEPITRYCDRHRLDTRARLELIMQVCEGVQHAHQKGIIHRDIKPSNVLVTVRDSEAIPRIIDFGVAKSTQQRLTERTVFTRLGVLIGTPEYMSPEQAEMTSLDIDTRTDVYSLGVLLYELLVGALPFDSKQLREAGFDEIRRRIREDEPSKPSTKIATLGEPASSDAAGRRGVDPATLRKLLRGDLDWITMRALEKDRTRRYGSPADLASDIGRHLKHEPVLAGPPTMSYRAKKFVRRHRVAVGVASAALMVLIAFAATMTFQARRIARERDRANREAETSERVSQFLVNMLQRVDPEHFGNNLVEDLRVATSGAETQMTATLTPIERRATDIARRLLDEEILDPALSSIEEELSDDPLLAARLRHQLGEVYRTIGIWDKARVVLESALSTRRQLLGPDHAQTLTSMGSLAWAYTHGLSNLEAAEALLIERADTLRRVRGSDDPETMDAIADLANNYQLRRQFAEAEAMLREVLQSKRKVHGAHHPSTARTMHVLAATYITQGRYEEAEPLVREALEIVSPDQPDWIWSALQALAQIEEHHGRRERAAMLLGDALEHYETSYGPSHPRAVIIRNLLARLRLREENYLEAARLVAEQLEVLRRARGPSEASIIKTAHDLLHAEYRSARYPEAERLALEVLELKAAASSVTLCVLDDLVAIYARQGRRGAMASFVERMLPLSRSEAEAAEASAGAKNLYAWHLLNYGLGNREEAAIALEFAQEAARMSEFEDGNILDTLALAYHRNGDTERAVRLGKQALLLVPVEDETLHGEVEARLAEYERAAKSTDQ